MFRIKEQSILDKNNTMHAESGRHKPNYPVKSLEKALIILRLMIEEGQPISLTEIGKKLGFGKGTVHRILATLKAHQFVRQDGETLKYGLGLMAAEMSTAIKAEDYIVKIIKPHLKKLSESCPEAISASVLEFNEIRYIARFESSEPLRVSIGEGTKFPAHCTATGKVLLAALSNEQLKKMYAGRENILTLTKNSIGSFARLLKELKRVRNENLALDFEEALVGVNCVARPIRDSKNEIVTAISISGPANRMTKPKMLEFAELLQNTSAEISKEI
jgi:DNA-binding IclR family transcriptional regulator